jgi:hypothetical protein
VGGGGERVGIFGKIIGERVRGYPFFGQEERRIGSFDTLFNFYGRKTLQNCSNNPFELIFGTYYSFLAFFTIFAFFGHFR